MTRKSKQSLRIRKLRVKSALRSVAAEMAVQTGIAVDRVVADGERRTARDVLRRRRTQLRAL